MPPETPQDRPNGDRVLVIDTETAAHNLALMLDRFRSGQAEPLIFGDEGRPEGVVIPFEQWERLEALAEDVAQTDRAREVTRQRLASTSPDEYVDVDDLAAEFGWNLETDSETPNGNNPPRS